MRKIYLLLTIGILTCINLFSNNDVCIIDLRGNDVPGAANFDELVVCGKTDTLALQIDAEISLSGATFEAIFPDGISYVGGAYAGNNQNLPTASGSSGNNPIFNLPSIPAGGSLVVNIPIKADCGIIPVWEGFQPIEFHYSVNAGGQTFDFTPILAYNNEIYVPSLNVLNVFPSYPSINIGDTFIREITISQDGINAFLTGFQFTHDYEPGVQYNSLAIGIPGGSSTNLSFADDGSQVTYQITAADLSAIGLNGVFDESQTVVLYEEITVLACEGNSSLVNYDVAWGCDGELCESLEFVNGFSLNSGQPDVEFTVTGSEPDNFCATNFVEMTVANIGTEPVPNSGYAKDLSLKLDPQCGALEFSKNFEIIAISVNGNNIAIPSPNGVGDYPISLAGVLTDMDGDGSSDDLGLNDSFTIYVEYERKCQSLGCQDVAAPCDGFQIVADYKDQCNLIRAPELYQVFGTEYGSFQSQFVESGHVINGSPEEFKATFCYSFANADLTCPGAEVNLIFSTSNTDVTPLGATIDDGSGAITSNFTSLGNGEYSFSGGSTGDGLIEECWELDLRYEGPCSSAGPVEFTFDVVYTCPCSGCEITRACETYQSFIKNFCPGYGDDCLGILIEEYEINRTTMGWTDETMTTLVDPNGSGLVLDRAYVCDNINMDFGGVVAGPSGTVNQLDMIMEIIVPDGEVPLEFMDATLYVNGQPYCAGAVPDPVVAGINGNVFDWIFDLDGCLSANNLTINIGDEVYLDANFTIVDAQGLTNYWELVQFRSEFRVNGESVGCYDECFDFYVQKPDVQSYANTLVQIGCDSVMHLEGALGINSYTGDDFPNEYRPWIGNIQEIILDAPFGLNYVQGSAMMNVFDGTNTTSIPITPYQILGEHIFYFDDFTGLVVPDKTEGGIQISFTADFVGSCKVSSSEFEFSYVFDKYYYAINDNPGCIETVDGSVSNTVEFVKPSYHMAAVNPIQEATEQQVTWDIQVCGIYEGATANFSWMGFETQSNAMTLVGLEDITDPNNPISYSINSYGQNNGWAETGTFMDRDCRMFRITAEYSTCEIDKAIVRFNWNCADDFNGPDDFLYGCEPSEEIVELSLYPQESAIQANLTDLSDTIQLCEDGFFEIEFKNVKKGNVYDIVFQIIVPFNGVDFVPNSFEIAYPISNPYVPIGFNPTVVDTLPYGFVYQYDMNNVDPVFLNGLPAIPTPTDVENRFKIRFEVESFCGFVSGGVFRFITYGFDACGQQTPGTFQNEEIIIDGAAPQYSLATGIQTNTAAPCNGGTTFTVQVMNQGPEITGNNDQIEIVLPAGMSYQINSSAALWNIGEPTVVTQFGFDFVTWDLPDNIDLNETIEFAFTGTDDGSLTCAPIQFTAVTLSSVDLTCEGEACNVPIQTGGQIIDLEIVKPELSVINASLSSTCGDGGELVSATATIENIGAPASSGGSINLDFVYDANGDGVFDSGDEVIYSHSENLGIPTDGTAQVSAEFTTPAGMACPLLLVLNNQNNCICNTTAYAVSLFHYANAGPDIEACAGSGADQQVQLGCDPVAGYSYSWSPSNGFSCDDCANPMVALTNDTNAPITASYVLTTTRGNCVSNDTVVVTVLPATQSSDPVVNICEGEELQLSGPSGGSNYSWSPVAGVDDPNSQNTTVVPPNGNTVYTLSYETGTGCPSVHIVEVNVTENPTPVVTVEGNNSFCDNETIDVTLDAGAGYDGYTWYQEGNTNFTASTQTINVTTEGTYYVVVQNGNCESEPSNLIAITILGFSGPVISLNGPDTICEGESTELQITGDYTTINWYVANANGNPTGSSLGTGNNITISNAGMYVAEVVDENGCEGLSNVIGVMVNPIAEVSILSGDQSICEGETVTLNATGGFDSYTWYLDGTEINGNSSSIEVSQAGDYTVEVNGLLVCSGTSDPISVSVNPNPTAVITVDNEALCDGEITSLVISGDYDSYQWYDEDGSINGAIESNLPVISAGTYYAEVTVDGCTGQTEPVEITVNGNPIVNITVENGDTDLCIGESTIITSNGTYDTYQWYDDSGAIQGEDGQDLIVDVSGTYYLVAATASGCEGQSDPITITVHPEPVVEATSSTTTICDNQSTTVSATTGFASYEWYEGSELVGTSETIIILETGNYYVIVTDENGCQGQSDPITITVNDNPSAVITIVGSGSLCIGESTNLLLPSDFDSYQWYDENGAIDGATENTLTVTSAGSYYAEVTIDGCTAETPPVEITVSASPTVDIYAENNDTDLCTGETTVLTTDDSYATYQWYDESGAILGGNEQDLTVDASGTYYLVVETDSGCQGQSNLITITIHSNPVVEVTSSNQTICENQSTTVSATTGFISYEWYEGSDLVGSSETIVILETGDYYVVVTDEYGCQGQSDPIAITVNETPGAVITIVGGGALCDGETTSLVLPSDFDSYQWYDENGAIDGATENTLVVNSAGTYYAEVTIDGCTSQTPPAEITVSGNPTVGISADDVDLCVGEETTITTNGTYDSYQWYNDSGAIPGGIGQSFIANASGNYYVIVETVSGCQGQSDPITITVHPNPVVEVMGSDETVCEGQATTITATTGFVSYEWYEGNTLIGNSVTATIVDPGDYYVVVTDEYGCQGQSDLFTAIFNPRPDAEITILEGGSGSCFGDVINLEASAGGIEYDWYVNGILVQSSTTANFIMESEGTVYVVISYLEGCASISNALEFVFNALPEPQIIAEAMEVCVGESVELIADVTGVTYTWTSSDINSLSCTNCQSTVATPTTTTIYTLTVENSDGCTSSTSDTIVVSTNPIVDITVSNNQICSGDEAVLTATEGFDTYVWTNQTGLIVQNGISNEFTTSLGGTYTVVATNESGCSGTSDPQTVTISNNPSPVVSVDGDGSFCPGQNITVQATAGFDNYQWFENGLAVGGNSNTYSTNNESAIYVIVTNADGCSGTSNTVNVFEAPLPEPAISSSNGLNLCSGQNTVLSALDNGANYTWTSSNEGTLSCLNCQSPTVNPTSTTTYTLTITNANGCTATSTVTINVSELPTVSLATNNSEICAGGSTLLTATAGFQNYVWYSESGVVIQEGPLNTFAADLGGAYYVVASNGAGCFDTSNSINITINPPPSVVLTVDGNGSFCEDQEITIQATPGYASYVWTQNGQVVSENTASFTAQIAADIYVTITDGNGCTATSEIVSVSPSGLPMPEISLGNATICEGSSTTLMVVGTYPDIVWRKDGVLIPNAINNSLVVTESGSYTVTVNDLQGCAGTSEPVTITVFDLPEISLPTGPYGLCGDETATIVAPIGFVNYAWYNNGTIIQDGASNELTTSENGLFYVVVTNDEGCSTTSNIVEVDIYEVLNANIVSNDEDNTICLGDCVQLFLNTDAANYSWSPADGSLTCTDCPSPICCPLGTTTYTVTMTSDDGCVSEASITINTIEGQNAALQLLTANGVCEGGSVGVSAPTGFEDYTWYNTQGIIVQSGTANDFYTQEEGSYFVQAIGAGGCLAGSDTIGINFATAPELPVLNIGDGNNFCEDGAIALSATSGDMLFEWTIQGNSASSNPQGATLNYDPINYAVSVAVTNDNGCTTESEPMALNINEAPMPVINHGNLNACDGDCVPLSVLGNYSIIEWYLNGILIENAISNEYCATESGVYSVFVNDENGCSGLSEGVEVVINDPIVVNVDSDGGVFCQSGTGEVVLTGPSGYDSYNWYINSTALVQTSTSPSYTVTQDGYYTLVVVDAFGCEAESDPIEITLVDGPVIIISSSQTSVCPGESVGLFASCPSDNVSWSDGGDGSTLSCTDCLDPIATPTGTTTYTITVTDENGCVSTKSITIYVEELPALNIEALSATSFCDGGSALLLASEGFTHYYWLNEEGIVVQQGTTNSFNATESGAYTVYAETASDCVAYSSDLITVSVTAAPYVTIISDATFCEGGDATITATAGYNSYEWFVNGESQGASTSNEFMVTDDATVNVIVTNAEGCVSESNELDISISASLAPEIYIVDGDSLICDGEYVQLMVNGMYAQYKWFLNGVLIPNSNATSIEVNEPGTYHIYVNSNDGCEGFSQELFINAHPNPTLEITPNEHAFCAVMGTIELTATPGFSTYHWYRNGLLLEISENNVLETELSGSYTIEAVTENGCQVIGETPSTITVYPHFPLNIMGSDMYICPGDVVQLSANSTGVSYDWEGTEPDTFINCTNCPSPTVQPFVTTTYTLSMEDINGCFVAGAVTIIVAEDEVPVIEGEGNIICENSLLNLSIQPNYNSYQWYYNGIPVYQANTSVLNISAAGDYHVEVMSSNNCPLVSEAFTVYNSQLETPTVTIDGDIDFCLGGGSVNLVAGLQSDGTAFDNHSWFANESVFPIGNASSVPVSESGSYVLMVEDANGCQAYSDPVIINISESTNVSVFTNQTDICQGETTTLFIAEEEEGLIVFWFEEGNSNVPLNTESAVSIEVGNSGNYYAEVFNTAGCEGVSNTVAVNVIDIPSVNITPDGPVEICEGGTATLSTQGGFATYSWYFNDELIANAEGTTYETDLPGSYTVVVTTEAGCQATSNSVDVIQSVYAGEVDFVLPSQTCMGVSTLLTYEGIFVNNDDIMWDFGSASLTVKDGEYTLIWDAAGLYTVTAATTNGGCYYEHEQTIQVNAPEISYTENILCATSCTSQDGSISLQFAQNTDDLTIAWTGPNGFTSSNENISGLADGDYEVIITDANGCSVSAVYNVCIQTQTIEANDDFVNTAEDTSVEICILSNDTGNVIDFNTIEAQPANGSLSESANGCMVYTPNPGYIGPDQFTYSIVGDCGDVSVATVYITVEQGACNELIAADDSYTANTNSPIGLCILNNDSGDGFTMNAISSDVQFGTLELGENDCYTYTPDNDFVGTDFFIYSIIDECGNIDVATVTITVADECAEIIANNDVLEAVTNIPATICVMVNDAGTNININGIATDALNGTVTATADGCYTYQSLENFVGGDSFVYTITDECGNTATATVQINVGGPVGLPNDPPFENTFETCVEPITPTDLCYELIDPNNDNTYITEYSSLFDCSIEIIDDNCIQYTALPALEYDVVTLTVCDNGDPVLCSETTINVTVGGCVPCESTVVANNDQATIEINTSYSTCVLDNDSGSGISVSGIATQAQNGTLEILPSGCIIYTPNDFYVGGDSYVYTVVDDCGGTAQATVNINVIDDSNDPPNVEIIEYCVDPVTPTVICHEFTDPNGHGTMITETNSLFDCSAVILNDSCLRYTSLPGIIGTDTVTLTICDDYNPSECSISQLVIHVGCEMPTANNDVLMLNCNGSTFNGQALSGNQAFDLAANDLDNNYCSDVVQVTIETSPSGGVLSGVGNNSSYTYIPNTGFSGTEVINYTLCNECGMCSTASLTIEVENCAPDTECNPISAICTQEITPTPICVEFCDLSMTNNPEFYEVNSLFDCSLEITEFPCIIYTAVPGFVGNELLELIACDDLGVCDTAFVNVTVGECTGLEAIDDVYTIVHNTATPLDILANDNGSNFTLDEYTQTVNGTLTDGNGGLIYTPNDGYVGEDNFTYTICDDAGNCDEGIVYISVSAACNNVFNECTAPFTSVSICPDFCGDVTGFSLTDVTTNELSTIDITDGLCFDYTPQTDAGLDTIVATACAPNNVDCSTVYIVMDIVCSEPIAFDDYGVMLQEYGSITIDVLFNDEDACRNQLTIAAIGEAQNGTVSQGADGALIYEPNAGFEGEDSFEYTACNGCGNCDAAIVNVNVQANGALALAVDDEVQTLQNKSVQVDVLSNDVNLNYSINIENWTNPREGSVLLMNDREFIYKPNLNFVGVDSFDYEIHLDGLKDEARVFVEVLEDGTAQVLAPGAEDDFANTNEGQAVDVDLTSNDENIGENPYISITSNVPDAGVLISGDGTITVTPISSFIGTITFDYEICNDSGLCDVATVTVEVRPAGTVEDAPPIAQDDEATILTGETINIAVLTNDSDPLGGLLEVTIISGTENGTVNVNGDNTVSYIPNPSFIGTDVFQYEICNEAGLCASANVTVVVEDCELRIPNAFSPNGDSKNDLFEVVGLECFDSAEIQIFNRWGNQVYESSKYNDEINWWNGRTDNTGSELPEGVYFYVLKIANGVQDPIINKGYINIKR